jgi:hypothetical protein
MMGLIEDYVDNYYKFIPSIKLLEQFKVFGDDHKDDDLAIAFGWCLIVMQADKVIAKSATDQTSDIPTVTLKKHNGVIQYVNQGKPLIQKPKFASNSLLFKR